MDDMERRSFDFDVKVERRNDSPPKIVGHAAVFNQYTNIGWFEERVMPGAFRDSIKADDVRALFNHDPNYVLGRNKVGTLELREDEKGLRIEANPPDTQWARDLVVSIERGDISQMSFGFQTLEDSWTYGEDGDPDKRDLVKVKLFDVSPVTFPAYEGTDVAVRSWEKQRRHKPKRLDILRKRLKLKGRRFNE